MFATIRRYEGVDPARTSEITGKVNETLIPKLSKLDGFAGYYLIEGTNGVLSSLGLFQRFTISGLSNDVLIPVTGGTVNRGHADPPHDPDPGEEHDDHQILRAGEAGPHRLVVDP